MGSFGNATRISRIYHYLSGLCEELILCNLHESHDSWVKLLRNPSFLGSTLRNVTTCDPAFIKSEAFVSIGKRVLETAIRTHRPQLIFAEETRTAYMAVKNSQNIPVIADLHGVISAEYAEDPTTGVSDRHLARLKEIEDIVCTKAQDVLIVSGHMKEHLRKEYGISENKTTVIQNGADLHSSTASHSTEMKLVFGGIFNYWEDVDTYLDMAAKDSTNRYFLVGRGPLSSHLFRRIKKEKINVAYLGSMDRTEALDVFCMMTVGVAPSTRNVTRQVASPVKIYDYLACGLPVVTADCGEWASQVRENGCGFVTENSSADEFLECAAKLQDKRVWEQKSANCRRAIETRFNWGQVLAPLRSVVGKYS